MNFVEKSIKKYELTDLDLGYPFYSGDERNDINYIDTNCESPSVSIDEVVNLLLKLKDEGADRVYIESNPDHRGYEFEGVKLEG